MKHGVLSGSVVVLKAEGEKVESLMSRGVWVEDGCTSIAQYSVFSLDWWQGGGVIWQGVWVCGWVSGCGCVCVCVCACFYTRVCLCMWVSVYTCVCVGVSKNFSVYVARIVHVSFAFLKLLLFGPIKSPVVDNFILFTNLKR